MNVPERIAKLRSLMKRKESTSTLYRQPISIRASMLGNILKRENLSQGSPDLPEPLSLQKQVLIFGQTEDTSSRLQNSLRAPQSS